MAKIHASEFIHRINGEQDDPDNVKAYLLLLNLLDGVEYDTETGKWNLQWAQIEKEDSFNTLLSYLNITEQDLHDNV